MEANALKEQQAHSPGQSAYAPLGRTQDAHY